MNYPEVEPDSLDRSWPKRGEKKTVLFLLLTLVSFWAIFLPVFSGQVDGSIFISIYLTNTFIQYTVWQSLFSAFLETYFISGEILNFLDSFPHF